VRRSGKKFVFCLLIFLLFTHVPSPKAEETGDGVDPSSLSVCQNKGLLTIEAKDIPLSTLLAEISRKSGTAFTMRESSLSADRLSVSLSNLPLKDAIERVLKNYSYIVQQGEDERLNIVILALKGADGILPEQPQTQASHTGKEIERASIVKINDPTPPQDDCRRLWFPDIEGTQHFSGGKGVDRLQADPGDIVARARQVLTAKGCSDLWGQVIDVLSGVSDPRAADLLAEIAEKGDTTSLRGRATEALWRNTALSEFNNASGLSALERLSSSADEVVRSYAQHALEDYNSYISRVQAGVNEPKQPKDGG
jgi:hypothetical protein